MQSLIIMQSQETLEILKLLGLWPKPGGTMLSIAGFIVWVVSGIKNDKIISAAILEKSGL